MFLSRMRYALPLLALALLFAPARAFADYASTTVTLGGTGNSVAIEAYDGNGVNFSSLNAGQVRLTFLHTPGMIPPVPNTVNFHGFQSVGFNTDLSLTAGQISGPANWTTSQNVAYSNVGTFGWVVGSVQPMLQDNVTLLVSGLGSNASLSHFLVGTTQFAGNVVNISAGPNGISTTSQVVRGTAEPQATPEPTSLALAGLGLGAFGVRRYVRRGAKA